MELQIAINGADTSNVSILRTRTGGTLWVDGIAYPVEIGPGVRAYDLRVGDGVEHVWVAVDHDDVWVHAFGQAWHMNVTDPVERALLAAEQADLATAPMPGMVISVAVEPGDEVAPGQQLVVIESMKMQSEIVAWRAGLVESLHVAVGDTFDRGARLVSLQPEAPVA